MRLLFPTTIVGSYPQPDWLIDKAKLLERVPPRVRATELWRVPAEYLQEAMEDATLVAIRAQEEIGIDVVTDGEIRRESYFNHFANALEGIDLDRPGIVLGRTGLPTEVPRVVGPIRRRAPVEVEAARFLRANTDRATKITVPGPFTMTMLAKDEHYGDDRKLAMAYADAVNAELKDLKAVGIDVLQIDEPYLSPNAEKARGFALEAIDRALHGVEGPTAIHLCMGYAYVVKTKATEYAFLRELNGTTAAQVSIEAAEPDLDLAVLKDLPGKSVMVGVLNLGDPNVETPELIEKRLTAALQHIAPERLIAAPDCGLKYLPRATAYGKMAAMTEGARRVRVRL